MRIEIWDGGLQEQEIEAIKAIGDAFAETPDSSKARLLRQDPGPAKSSFGGMYPWKGYAGFRFVDSNGKEGEFDLLIVTHCNVIIVELKDWNREAITAQGDIWFKGDRNMGRSPVSVTRNKKFLMEKKLKRHQPRLSNRQHAPHVHFFVVMTGTSNFSQLPDVELRHTLSLKEFLAFSEERTFNEYFRPHPESKVLNRDFPVFDEIFLNGRTAPKALRLGGYTASGEIFVHPNEVYKEYLASSEISKGSTALLRMWNFAKIPGNKGFSAQGRAEIVSREREILEYIHVQDRDLYNHCLRSLTGFEKFEVTSQYGEIYELPPGHMRFNEFIGKYGQVLAPTDRLSIVKLLIARFSDLHRIKIAHRDIADHSLWLSPSKEISLSSFISAYHQPIGTVGDYRNSLSVGPVEVQALLDRSSTTPFQQDVHALGLVSWHLLSGQRMSSKSLRSIAGDISSSDEWYGTVLIRAVTGDFQDASEFFDALKQAEPATEEIAQFDDSELEAYRHSINHSRQFPEDGEFLVSTDDKEVYFSSGRLVKTWLNVGGKADTGKRNFEVLAFLKRLDKLAALGPVCLPRIHEYGLAMRSGCMYLVTEKIEGQTWAESNLHPDGKIRALEKLVDAVKYLHGIGFTHGDLHPGNVMLDAREGDVFLIDIPDFLDGGSQPGNHRYSPENIDGCTAIQRDIFAVLRMSCELLEMEWGQPSKEYPHMAAAVTAELQDPDFGFRDLGRFAKAVALDTRVRTQAVIDIFLSSVTEEVTLYPDNGQLFGKAEASRNDQNVVFVTFAGIGGTFRAFYNKAQRCFVTGLAPLARADIDYRLIQDSQFELNVALRIRPGRPDRLQTLSEYLAADEAFQRSIIFLQAEPVDIPEAAVSHQLKEVFERADGPQDEASDASFDIRTEALWRAILGTETESSPNIELHSAPLRPADADSELILLYDADLDPLASFARADEIEALLVTAEGEEKVIGEVVLRKSALNEVRLARVRKNAYGLREGDAVFFRTRADRASHRKRKLALERLLDREGVVPELVDLFDPACKREATDYALTVSDEDFTRYDRQDQHGNLISLNPQQREAFRKLLNHGPLSLLQGPPGTGKTEFIAAFVHFLVEKLNVRRILLVSQSHEAVNTAAERIRKHCRRLGTELEVVRFSNREGAVSHGLKDVYSHSLTAERRELFNAEFPYRVAALADALGLDAEFISRVVDAELRLFKKIDHLESQLHHFENIADEEDIRAMKLILADMDATIRENLLSQHGIALAPESKISEAKSIFMAKICAEYGVRPNEARKVKALARIARDMQDALSAERVNCDEFYARSRQLVTGTCVGIGQGHIAIQDVIYDFVIIDEAARSISSELAIAMQSAKRVLLVGDHLQLPPLYSDAHKAALARRLGIHERLGEVDEILRSDFARAFHSGYGQQTSATLLTQYRMAAPIGDLVSQTFYGGKLSNGQRPVAGIYQTGPGLFHCTVTWLDTSALGDQAHHQRDRGVSIYNRCEADQIMHMLKAISEDATFLAALTDLREHDEPLIGVVCMYAEQKRLLRQKFNQEIWSEGFRSVVKIDTVDSYQGKENRIIIVSLTRSDRQRSPGFLRAPNRINVALSRAMDRLVIVGDVGMWTGHHKDKPLGQITSYMLDKGVAAGYRFVEAEKLR